MILPGSYLYSLIVLAVGLVLMGSWANTFKSLGGKWRYELYYFDVAIGAFLVVLLAALTLGSFGFDGFSFTDDLRLAGKRQDVFAFLAGGLFNVGNMLMVAGLSLTAMSIALPTGLSTALIVASLADLAINRQSSVLFVVAGAATLVVGIAILAMTWHEFAMARLMDLVKQGKTKSTRRTISMKGVGLSVVGGVFMGLAQPLIDAARRPEVGLGPYSLGFLFALGVLFSAFVTNLFLMNLPVAGEPIDIFAYFEAKVSQHLSGFIGGVLLGGGVLASMVVARAEGAASVAPRVVLPITQAAILLTLLWGLVRWKELRGTEANVRSHLALAALLLVAGIGLTAFALPGLAR